MNIKRQIIIPAIVFGLLISGCSPKYESWDEPYEPGEYEREEGVAGYTGELDSEIETADEAVGDMLLKKEKSSEKGGKDDADTGGTKEKPGERKRVYFGFLKLLVDSIKDTKSSISTMAEETGGYVESSYGEVIIIRVPKEQFEEVFSLLKEYGEVVDKSIETYDVTEFFQDLTAHLAISEKTRNRLYDLLEKTTDVKERLKILKEIKRLTEEIERIKLTLESIKRLIAFSRITIELEQRLSDLSGEDKRAIPFPWIAALDPFYTTIDELDGKPTIEVGDDFAVFDKRKYYFAESTEGIRLRAGTTRNYPEGDGAFWQQALVHHLSPFYGSATPLVLGDVNAVLFESKDPEPFYYLVGVFVKERKIHVIEVLFPTPESFKKKGEVVYGYIKECRIQ
ncbi:MAG: DUF4349 domain-containing protein [Spirochaetales bacterium]|nr:DUF4349 domain-containing protein [Spirochaetales bacterium]